MLTILAEEIRKEGKMEEKIEFAKKMKEEGFDFNTISRITSLTIEQIEKLSFTSLYSIVKLFYLFPFHQR